ncbi:MAG: glucosyltransferase domain-containing protein [Oscillospiraceae bacterium]|nr:glucosyltransferase domain-containing protein [Oscillospiraceae bacterium]
MREQESIKDKRVIIFLCLLTAIFARYCYYGFNYFYQLDDYIQYHNYVPPGNGTPFQTIINLGLLAARPLAGLSDVLIWSRFFPVMIVAVLIFSAMLACSACLFQKVWSRHFDTGYVFLVVYALLPLGIEGIYWVSASSRIVPGLFFASISLYCFERWCEVGKMRLLIFFILAQIAAYGFYEQAMILSLTATLTVSTLHFKRQRARALWGLISFANVAAYFFLTRLTRESVVYGTRLGIIRAFGYDYWRNTFPAVFNQVRDVFIKGGVYTLIKGTYRGVLILIAGINVVYILTILFVCAAFFLLARGAGRRGDDKKPWVALICGGILAVAPVGLFFVIPNAWFSLRSAVMSFCGIAMMADALVSLATRRLKRDRTLTAIAVSGFVLICSVAAISEMHDYRQTMLKDQQVVEQLAKRLEADGKLNPELQIAVLNLNPSYLKDQNFYFHEHIHGVTESSWALTGALEWKVGITRRPAVTPLPGGILYRPWNADASRLNNFDGVYIYLDNEIIKISAVKSDGGDYRLHDLNGRYIGRVWEEDNYGYLELLTG